MIEVRVFRLFVYFVLKNITGIVFIELEVSNSPNFHNARSMLLDGIFRFNNITHKNTAPTIAAANTAIDSGRARHPSSVTSPATFRCVRRSKVIRRPMTMQSR